MFDSQNGMKSIETTLVMSWPSVHMGFDFAIAHSTPPWRKTYIDTTKQRSDIGVLTIDTNKSLFTLVDYETYPWKMSIKW